MKWKQKLTIVLLLAGGVLAALDTAYVTREAAENERQGPATIQFAVR